MRLNLNLPVNSVSFGQLSTLLLREFFESKKDINLFPIGNIDLNTQDSVTKEFGEFLNQGIGSALNDFDRHSTIFKLWHLNGSLESFANKQVLLSFYELDSPTKIELNIIKNNNKVLFSSKETVDLFKTFGCSNVEYVPLAFDKYNFKQINKKYFDDDRIIFNLTGKLEKRKHHLKLIKAWANKFGNNKKYSLQCSIFNPFLKAEDQTALLSNTLEGKNYFNISFLGFMPQNKIYNDYLNSGDIIIGLSGGEGWGLPEFHSVALGKHGVIMNAHGYKSWANEKNAILVNPNSKIDACDNVFFHRNQPFNQGNIYDFSEDDFISACENAIERVRLSKVNQEGLKLQEEFSSQKFADNITKYLI
jgi:glycosyltransferase involved in cell wall biosynthesis